MICPKCGKENADSSRFCVYCGSPMYLNQQSEQQYRQQNEQQEQQRNQQQYQQQYQQQNQQQYQQQYQQPVRPKKDKNILVTIAAIVFAVLYAISVLRGIWGIGSNIVRFFEWGYYPGMLVFNLINCVINVITSALLAVVFFALAFGREKRTTQGLLFGVAAAAVIRIIACILMYFVFLMESLVYRWGFYGMNGYQTKMLYVLVAAVVVILLLIVTGECDLKITSGEDLKDNLAQVPGALMGALGNLKKEEKQGLGNDFGGQPYRNVNQNPNQNMNMNQNNDQNYNQNYNQGYNQGYGNAYQGDLRPAFRIKTDRSLVTYILLSIITCGIYSYYFLYTMARDANTICEGDGDKTGGLLAFILLSMITCGIYGIYWEYKLGNRLAENAPRYGLMFQENGTSVLVWYIFGVLVCGIGPFVAMSILIKNMNRLAMAYNQRYGL